MRITIFYASVSLLILLNLPSVNGQDPVLLTKQMCTRIQQINTLQCRIKSEERVKGKMHTELMSFKIMHNPLKIYIFQYYPTKGLQILYLAGDNNARARVYPGTFPWITLNLDPDGDIMLSNRHHSIFDSGFHYTISILQYLMDKYASTVSKLLSYDGTEVINQMVCYHITLFNPYYRLILFSAKEGDTPMRIAKELHINFYEILRNNPGLKPDSKIKSGTKVIVPDDYASKMELYIQKNQMYPVMLKVYDDKGLFEQYTFKDVEINPVFTEMDFSEKNPSYKF